MALVKDRDISFSELYSNLQLEYISYKIREKIYVRAEDKKKFNDISAKKKSTIQQMSKRNRLPSIFNSEEQQEKYLNLFFNETGMPNFKYRDSYQLRVKGRWDKIYYFNRGTEVITPDKEIKAITSFDSDTENVLIDKEVFAMNQLSRVLSNNFLDIF